MTSGGAGTIVEGGLDDARVIALLAHHVARGRAETEPGSAHALAPDGLCAPDIRFWSIWDGDALAGTGALRTHSPELGEVKSMHIAEALRGRGFGAQMLRHIIDTAKATGLARLSLETGSWPYFAPAHALYRRHGFVDCVPFAGYRADPDSLFLTLDLRGGRHGTI